MYWMYRMYWIPSNTAVKIALNKFTQIVTESNIFQSAFKN